jgi:hypothetical protein
MAHVVAARASQNAAVLFQSSAIFTVTISTPPVPAANRPRRPFDAFGSGWRRHPKREKNLAHGWLDRPQPKIRVPACVDDRALPPGHPPR